jgi:hypothetical protein
MEVVTISAVSATDSFFRSLRSFTSRERGLEQANRDLDRIVFTLKDMKDYVGPDEFHALLCQFME